jgi:hypothetical protein
MGDGSKHTSGVHLSVYAFSERDVSLLLQALAKLGLDKCTLHPTKSGPRIYIPKGSLPLLCAIVEPYMVPSMMYKLGK